MSSETKNAQAAKGTAISMAMDWGKSPLPPTILATLLTALHMRPFQRLPMLFPPVLLLSTYLNLNSFVTDSAGITAAWSGLYLIMANRRKVRTSGVGWGRRVGERFGARGLTRGSAMVLAGMNVVGGGLAYTFGKREKEESVI
ncbi:hypothetical protein HYFRA_00000999 [Hymenoscyphus fraxineus]|uniref:Altered inheritance of mitochondria protein 19 n=1 Tax=Hymenoscyphus fraxineus TaxID=746836 RepID=A0A9N9KQW2_9HELO|nr:hypothetical protein HYFRA_00000999 [Hymenoscyphus fraxineus]